MGDRKSKQNPDHRTRERNSQRFAINQAGKKARPEPQCFERGILADAFARSHCHGVRHYCKNDEDHHERNDAYRHDDGFGHGDKTQLKRLLCFGKGFCERVFEQCVDLGRYFRSPVGIRDLDYVYTHMIGSAGNSLFQRFIEVIPVKEKLRGVRSRFGAVVNSAHRKTP